MKNILVDTYQQFIEKKVRLYKDQSYGRLVLSGRIGKKRFELLFLTASCENDRVLIALLSKWRKKHEAWFASQFSVSRARTKVWYKKLLIDKPDRLLFMIRVSDRYIGHVGLNRFNFKSRSCEIDNIVRGATGYPGIIEKAIILLMRWGEKSLGIHGYSLSTFSDNKRALNLYQRLGFAEMKRELAKLLHERSPAR